MSSQACLTFTRGSIIHIIDIIKNFFLIAKAQYEFIMESFENTGKQIVIISPIDGHS